MENTKVEERKQFVLCLSGGGFRAAFFHIGVVRRLIYLGLFEQVVRINSVSGGSIFAGLLMKELSERGEFHGVEDYDQRIIKPFVQFVQKSPRNKLTWLKLMRVNPRKFANYLEKELYGDLPFTKLTPAPFWCCYATSLDSGKQWRFSQTGIGETAIGTSDPLDSDKMAIGVASSSCFQPYFKPMVLDLSNRQWVGETNQNTPRKVHLSDGGVYDNLAVRSVLDADHQFLIVSDASGHAPSWQYGAPIPPVSKLKRPIDISLAEVNNLARLAVFNRTAAGKEFAMIENVKPLSQYTELTPANRVPPTPASEMPKYDQLNHELEDALGRLRTDLNAFHDAEIQLLIYSGMVKIDAVFKRWNPDLVKQFDKLDIPHLHLEQTDGLYQIIIKGAKRRRHRTLHFEGMPKFSDEITRRLDGEKQALAEVATSGETV